MQPRVLLVVAFLTLLASARADVTGRPLLLGSMQGYMEQAARTVQDALTSVQKSDMAQQAKGWMDGRFDSLMDYWSSLTGKLSGLWDSRPEVQPTPDPMA
nr:apolipoprotein C-III [Jaculus jaculus]